MKSFSHVVVGLLSLIATVLFSGIALAAPEGGGEASLVVPHEMIGTVTFMGGTPGRTLLMVGLGVALARHGLRPRDLQAAEERARPQVDARDQRAHLRDLQDVPRHADQVHPHPRGLHRRDHRLLLRRRAALLRDGQARRSSSSCSSASSASPARCAVAWFGIRVNTFANSRTAFAALGGKPFPCYAIPLKAGMSIGMLLISRRAHPHARHPPLHPRRVRRPVLHRLRHRRVARRLGAPHRGRHLHEDRRHRLRPHEDRLQDQGRRRA